MTSPALADLAARILSNTLTVDQQTALAGALAVIAPLFPDPDNLAAAVDLGELEQLWFATLFNINAEGGSMPPSDFLTDVTGTPPIDVTTPGPGVRNVAIRASTPTLSGSMSAAQATKLANLTPTSPLVADLDADGHAIENVKVLTFDELVDNGASGAAKTIDWRNGGKQTLTLTADCTLTFTAPPGGAANLQLQVVQGPGGNFTITAPASVRWTGSTPPVLSTAEGAIDWLSFIYTSGPHYDGQLSPNFG